MAGGWETALGLGLCLAALHHGGCRLPSVATAPQTPAVLRDNFRLQPGDLVTTTGQALELDCVPPLGYPEPYITWKKDGVTLDLVGGRYVVTKGKLHVASAQRSDSGLYICVAANAAGKRESRGARVSVLEKPSIVRHPSDAVAVAGSTVQLGCSARGDPAPQVQWHKERGDLPWGRHEVDREHTLHLYAVTSADAGAYVCTAQSQLGTATATTFLHVEDRLAMGQQETAPRDLLAVRLHLDNGTALPTAAVQLRWQMLMPVPVPVDYVVLYRSLLPVTTSWVQHDAGRELSTIIPALRRGYKYEFKVRPYTGGAQGSDSNSRHLWIPEEVPSAAPQRVTVSQAEAGNGTVIVSWEPPPPEAHNGVIRGYQVWSMGEGWQHPTNRTVDGATHRLENLLLHPGAEFCVQVAAFNSAGLGVPSNATCGVLGLTAGSSRVVQALQQPAVIAAAGSMLWLALLALLLLLCQRRASQDTAARHRLVAGDSPWLGGPWKPSCAPRNLSSSSSLSSRLLGSDGRDPHPSTLSLEPPSLGPPTPPIHSSLRGGHPPPLGDMGCCGGGHPGVHSSPSTPNPAPWERVRKRELHQVHSTPVLTAGPSHVPVTGSGGKWGTDFGQAARQPQQRGHDGDTIAAMMDSRDPQLPVFSSPKPHRGSTSLASGVTTSLVTPPRPPHAWHPPVTRSPASMCPRDTSVVTRHPKDMSPVPGIPRDMSPVTESPRDVSPATRNPRDMSLVTEHPKDMFLDSRHAKDVSSVTRTPRNRSPATRHHKDPSPATKIQRDTVLATRHPEDTSLVTRCPRDPLPVAKCQRDISLSTRHPKDMSPTSKHPKDTSHGTGLPKEMSPPTRHRRDKFLASSRSPENMSPALRHPNDILPATGHARDTPPLTKHPEEMSPVPKHHRDKFLDTRYSKDMSQATRNPRDTSLVTMHTRDMSPCSRSPENMSPAIRHPKDTSPATRHPRDTSPATRHPEEASPITGHQKDKFLDTRYAKDMSPATGRLSPAFSDGVLTQQQVAEVLEMEQDTNCCRPPAPTTPRSFSPLHTYGYIYGPSASELGEEEEEEHTATRGSPGGSLLNGWGSVSEDIFASTRCSLVSSCDGSFLLDASFARALAVAIDGLCYSLEDTDGAYEGPSPPPSPLEQVFPPGVHTTTWDWRTVLEVPQRTRTEAAMNSSSQDGGQGPRIGSPWTREGGELRTGARQSPGRRTQQGQTPWLS